MQKIASLATISSASSRVSTPSTSSGAPKLVKADRRFDFDVERAVYLAVCTG
jgi:hypothetical protein